MNILSEKKKLVVKETILEGVKVVIPPTIFNDFRGDYVETYNRELYKRL